MTKNNLDYDQVFKTAVAYFEERPAFKDISVERQLLGLAILKYSATQNINPYISAKSKFKKPTNKKQLRGSSFYSVFDERSFCTEKFEMMALDAESDKGAFMLVKGIVSSALRKWVDVPDAIKKWAADYVEGEIQYPKKSGRIANLLKAQGLVCCVAHLKMKFPSLTIYKNEASEHENNAIAIVAKAAEACGYSKVSEASVKNACLKHPHYLHEFDNNVDF